MATKLKKSLGKIHHGDCLKGLQTLTKESVDLAFADPPFNIGYEYDEYDDQLEADKYVAWCSDWMSEIKDLDKKCFWNDTLLLSFPRRRESPATVLKMQPS